MIWRAALVAALFWPAAALAAPVTVRSGEHPGFSRLVLFLDAGTPWRLGRVEGGYELQTEAPDGFDVTEVWRLIPRDRIAALEPAGDGRIVLRVDCACHANAFEIPQGLVVDIRDGAPPAGSPFETAIAPVAVAAPPPEGAAPVASRPPPAAPSSLPTAVPQATAPFTMPVLPGVTVPEISLGRTATPAPMPPAAPPPEPDLVRLEEVQARLAAQLARAAAQGVIRLEAPPTADQTPAPRTPTEIAVAPPVDPAPVLPAAPPLPADHLRIRTVLDRDGPDGPPETVLTDQGSACIAAARVDVAAWRGRAEGPPDLAIHRTRLVDAFDAPVPIAIRDAARQAIGAGFGAEARALLAAFDTAVPDAALLEELAQVVDGGTVPGGVFASQSSCDGPVALWSVLARGEIRPGERVAASAVVGAFAALPAGLRQSLGPDLAEIFLEVGDTETAATIRNAIARAVAPQDAGLALLETRMAAVEGGVGEDAMLAELDRLARGPGPRGAEALVDLIDRLADAGAPVAPDLADRAAGLAGEYGGTPLGPDLVRAHIRGLTGGGQYETALDAIARAADNAALPEQVLARLRAEVVVAVAGSAASLPVLLPRLVRAPLDLGAGQGADRARRALAGALLASGLPAAARDILAARPGGPEAPDRLILAEARLAEAAPEMAYVLLTGLEGPQAERLRARALLEAGRPDDAAERFETLGDMDAAADAAWRAGDLPRVARLGSDARQAAALLAARDDEDVPGAASGQLARTRDLMEASARTRAAIDALLANGTGD